MYFHHGGICGVVIHVSRKPHNPRMRMVGFQYGAAMVKYDAMSITIDTATIASYEK